MTCHIQTTNPQPATTPMARIGNRTTVRNAKTKNSLRFDAINGSWDIAYPGAVRSLLQATRRLFSRQELRGRLGRRRFLNPAPSSRRLTYAVPSGVSHNRALLVISFALGAQLVEGSHNGSNWRMAAAGRPLRTPGAPGRDHLVGFVAVFRHDHAIAVAARRDAYDHMTLARYQPIGEPFVGQFVGR